MQMDPASASSSSTSSTASTQGPLPPASTLYPISVSTAESMTPQQTHYMHQQLTDYPYYTQAYTQQYQSAYQPYGDSYSYWTEGGGYAPTSVASYTQAGQFSGSSYNVQPTYADLSPVETFLFGNGRDRKPVEYQATTTASQEMQGDFMQLQPPVTASESW